MTCSVETCERPGQVSVVFACYEQEVTVRVCGQHVTLQPARPYFVQVRPSASRQKGSR